MAKEEWISPAIFKRRLAISGNTYRTARSEGRIHEETKNGRRLIEWISQSKNFINTSREPMRYRAEEVNKRLRQKGRAIIRANGSPVSPAMAGKDDYGLDDFLDVKEPEDEDGEFTPEMGKRQSEAVKQLYLAKQAKLKYLKDIGLLVETEAVIREWQEIAIYIQKQMLSIPDRVSELFASINDPREIQKILITEITHVLTGLKYEVKNSAGEKLSKEETEI